MYFVSVYLCIELGDCQPVTCQQIKPCSVVLDCGIDCIQAQIMCARRPEIVRCLLSFRKDCAQVPANDYSRAVGKCFPSRVLDDCLVL